MVRAASLLQFVTVAVALCLATLAISASAQENAPEAEKQAQAPIPILTYHRFDPTTPGPTTVTTQVFERQLEWLTAHHYKIVTLRAVVDGLRGTAPPVASPAVVLTADDGHRSVYTELFPIIRRQHIPVTLFIYPSAISNANYALTWDQLKEMLASGLVDVQSHTYWHPDFRKERAHRSPENYRAFVDDQLTRSKSVLEHRLGIKVDMLAWPYGIVDQELEAAAARAGYIAAFGCSGGLAAPGADPFALARIPVSNAAQGASFGALLIANPARKPIP
jgi:peptidoglycan/xylan/chitin deacetylase (PgdA/CDA1 family)